VPSFNCRIKIKIKFVAHQPMDRSMYLVADSGSTKTDWRIIDGMEVHALTTRGINPYHSTKEEIRQELASLDLRGEEKRIRHIYFYGSGVSNSEKQVLIRKFLQERVGSHPEIFVEGDLLGAARALFQKRSGIACILGTGSNSCLCAEGIILDHIPALGYSLGDEGSGTDIGKRLVNALHKRTLSDGLSDSIIRDEGLSMDQILENVYMKPHANRYLASLTRIAEKHMDNPEIREIISQAFQDFIQKNISRYKDFKTHEIGFAGSVAYHFRAILKEVMEREGLRCGPIISAPIEGLVKYHMNDVRPAADVARSLTESPSPYDNLEQMSVRELLENINREDSTVYRAVQSIIPEIEKLVTLIIPRINSGGRLFYVGAGTSGRLGIVDASEIPPTFGVPFDLVIGIIAGGDQAIRKAVESAEDDPHGAWRDLAPFHPGQNDTIVGIAASGRTPYVIGAVKDARREGLLTACITCNPDTLLAREVDIALEALVGPEFVTGSTRMKAGTAQKLILNMITTSTMIKLGRVKGNRMVDMQLTNQKLVERGSLMISEELGLDKEEARRLLLLHGSVRRVLELFGKGSG
jgi:N-acetylmuramic acid 6-phosphate etherase